VQKQFLTFGQQYEDHLYTVQTINFVLVHFYIEIYTFI